MLEPILPIVGIGLFLVFGFLAGIFGFDGWDYLSSAIRHRCELTQVAESFVVIVQFVAFNGYVASLLGASWLMFLIFGGEDFELRRLFGRLCLSAWACGLGWRVTVVQWRQNKTLADQHMSAESVKPMS